MNKQRREVEPAPKPPSIPKPDAPVMPGSPPMAKTNHPFKAGRDKA